MAAPLPVNSNPLLDQTPLGTEWLNPDFLFNQGIDFVNQTSVFLNQNGPGIMSFIHGVLFVFSCFFLFIMAYTIIRILEIRRKEHHHLQHEIEEYAHHQAEREKKASQGDEISRNKRWIKTLTFLFSQHPSDWKLAVIEADSMMEELMNQLGFQGATLGDKLKSATQEKFRSLTRAWEVHNIRNRIAHEGGSFELSQHEAKRVVAIYEGIFREFGFI